MSKSTTRICAHCIHARGTCDPVDSRNLCAGPSVMHVVCTATPKHHDVHEGHFCGMFRPTIALQRLGTPGNALNPPRYTLDDSDYKASYKWAIEQGRSK